MSLARHEQLTQLESYDRPLALALGVFDGLHVGHQRVLREAVSFARSWQGLAGVLTFEPHPVRVLKPSMAPRHLLASLEHKERLLARMGVDFIVVLPFTKEFAAKSPEEFLEVLRGVSQLRFLSMGEDWKFGRERLGTVAMLEEFGTATGVHVLPVSHVRHDGERVSSTRIRQAIRDGNLKDVETMLGRRYSIFGKVVEGARRGREIGFPTANVSLQNEQLPPMGVWGVLADWGEGQHTAVANLGLRPTVGSQNQQTLEVHIPDYSGDLYGREMEVTFLEYLRGEERFSSMEALSRQIASDVSSLRQR